MLYSIIKWIHILSAITALGANLTYPLWMIRASLKREPLIFTLRRVRIMDDWMANPAYILAFFTGAGMLYVSKLPYNTPWILTALILYAAVAVLGLFVYSPWLKKQIMLAESVGPDAAEYKSVANRTSLLGAIVTLMVLVITFLMVVKPQLW